MGNPAQSRSGGPAGSLDYAVASVRQRVSRVLHDDVGPSLCAAGLHLDLLASNGGAGEDWKESAEGLRAALDSALAAIRALLAENDVKLFARGGLDGGLTALARHELIDWEEPPTDCAWTIAQCELCFRVARDWATACSIERAAQRLRVRRSDAGMKLTVPGKDCSCQPWLEGWRHLAAAAGVEIICDDPNRAFELVLKPVPAGSRASA
ncbi:MAG: hypothetical protein KJZ84_16555 [Bryobacteraceae bacterium]|nr:hypothetical protein [Bryobacteraceae bacterium]